MAGTAPATAAMNPPFVAARAVVAVALVTKAVVSVGKSKGEITRKCKSTGFGSTAGFEIRTGKGGGRGDQPRVTKVNTRNQPRRRYMHQRRGIQKAWTPD